MGVFALFTVFSAGYIGWEEFHNPENEGFYETFLAMGHAASPFVILSAGFAVITVEVIAMIGDRLFRRRYLKEGFQQGREEERRLWLDWDKRRKEAEAQGEEFNEPPPGGGARTLPEHVDSWGVILGCGARKREHPIRTG